MPGKGARFAPEVVCSMIQVAPIVNKLQALRCELQDYTPPEWFSAETPKASPARNTYEAVLSVSSKGFPVFRRKCFRDTAVTPRRPFREGFPPCFTAIAFAKRKKCCILPAREALSAVSRQKHRTKRKNKQIHPVRVVIPMTLCSEDDVGVPTSSSMTLLGQFSAKTCSEEDVSTLTSSSATHTSQSPVNLCSEDNVSTSTSSSVTLWRQFSAKSFSEDNVSMSTSSSGVSC